MSDGHKTETSEHIMEKVSADTHIGLVRDHNEDSFAYYLSPGKHMSFVAVADGIGGHESGDIASNLCLKLLLSSFRDARFTEDTENEEWKKFLDDELRYTNEIIFRINEKYKIQHPMGTTVVAAVILKNSIIVAHAGDSRLYRVREDKIERLTQDHSFVAELVRKNIISEEEALTHPFAHIISKSVGPNPGLEPELNIFDNKPGDRYMLCSDGLTNHMDDNMIKKMMSSEQNPHDAVKNLLNASLRGGGEDNITIVCAFI
ncbi:MAG: hypothetical protein A2020_05785 [Lentisphaerae bacterium GWF2_45_14]|nr:MAG: hypothetical protein A2020_05785 [Lentisphaerae bacterium GWF2_45_14]